MTYTKIKPYKPKNEKELHLLINKHLDVLNLQLIQYEFKFESDIPDFLCIDENGKLSIIEVKLGIDKNIIFQAVRYYRMVEKYKYLIAKEIPKINPNEDTRVILIAKDYNNDTKNISEFLDIDLTLYTYNAVFVQEIGRPGITFNEVLITPSERLKPIIIPKIEDHVNRFSSKKIKQIYDQIVEKIKSLNLGIEMFAVKKYIGFKYKGRNVAAIHIRKTFFWLISFKYDEDRKYLGDIASKVETGKEEEINNVYETINKLIDMINS